MNEEYRRGWIATSKVMVAVIISTLWWLAGRGFGINRRFLLPLILVAGCMLFDTLQKKNDCYYLSGPFTLHERHYRFLHYASLLPLYYLSMSIFSYGASSWLRPLVGKYLQRVVVGVMWSLPAFPVARVNESMPVFIGHIIIFTLTMFIFGAFSIVNASAEEAIIGYMFGFLPLFMVKHD